MLRKGAVEAGEGKRFCLPFNMRDGIAVCVGRGNTEWNCSAPHGAGRAMSRNAAKKNIGMDNFEMSMSGIFSTSVCPGTLDESPQAYKSMEERSIYNLQPDGDLRSVPVLLRSSPANC